MADDRLLIEYLRQHDVPCPRCRYNLRRAPEARCPECGQVLRLDARVVGIPSADPEAERAVLTRYLSRNDAECLQCGAALRGHDRLECPQCGSHVSLSDLRQAKVGGSLGREVAIVGRFTLVIVGSAILIGLIWFGVVVLLR